LLNTSSEKGNCERKGEMSVDQERCSRCGKEITGGDEEYCPDCHEEVRRKKVKGRLFLAGTVAILILAGALYSYGQKNSWELSWDALLGRPAAIVNGEPVARSALQERMDIGRRMAEREYGKDLFTGERGRALLAELERDVLERIVEERLVAQEARRLKITVGDERVQQELQTIGKEIYGTWEKFRASLKEDGISPEYFADHVRNLILFREVNKAKAGGDSDQNAAGWLARVRQNATVTLNATAGPALAAFRGAGSCCGSGGGGGGEDRGGCGLSPSTAGPVAPELKEKATAAALAEYRKTNPAGQGLEARVTDYGCHIQVDIERGGKVVKSYAYQDGQAFEN
jgi:hypothetical protein